MKTMKKAYMLESVDNPGRYLLEERDQVWERACFKSQEDVSTYGRHFICEKEKKKATMIADRYNETAKEKAKVVEVVRGFVPIKKPEYDWVDPPHEIPDDLVWRRDIYRYLHSIGGTGARGNTWSAGWDDAVATAIDDLGTVRGASG